jgi:hypothetical protein
MIHRAVWSWAIAAALGLLPAEGPRAAVILHTGDDVAVVVVDDARPGRRGLRVNRLQSAQPGSTSLVDAAREPSDSMK